MTETQKKEIREMLIRGIPNFVEAIEKSGADAIIMTQSAFGTDESALLGFAVKYAGACGKEITVIP